MSPLQLISSFPTAPEVVATFRCAHGDLSTCQRVIREQSIRKYKELWCFFLIYLEDLFRGLTFYLELVHIVLGYMSQDTLQKKNRNFF